MIHAATWLKRLLQLRSALLRVYRFIAGGMCGVVCDRSGSQIQIILIVFIFVNST